MANIIADTLSMQFEETTPYAFYRDIFGEGNLDDAGAFTKGKYTGIIVELEYNDKNKPVGHKKHIVTDDLDAVDEVYWNSDNFCLMAPVSYAGWSRKTANARTMYALGVEIDHLNVEKNKDGSINQIGLKDLIHQWNNEIVPHPTYIVASGNGVHLYYVFEEPLRLTEWVKKSLMLYKEVLTRILWNQYVTSVDKTQIQYESAFQGFRMPGTATKLGLKTKSREDRARAFKCGEKVTVDYLNSFLSDESVKKGAKIEPAYEGRTSLKEAKEKWPEWYQDIIVDGKKYSKKWDIAGKVNGDNPYALYDWWKRKILAVNGGAVEGKRYHCLYCLAVYALKNNVSEETLVKDAYEIMDRLDKLTTKDDNHFTEADVEAALQVFQDEGYFKYPLKKIVSRSGIYVEPNKRNGRKREDHIKRVNAMRKFSRDELGEDAYKNNGRPDKAKLVKQYRKLYPDGTKADCNRATGLDPKTIRKWWD